MTRDGRPPRRPDARELPSRHLGAGPGRAGSTDRSVRARLRNLRAAVTRLRSGHLASAVLERLGIRRDERRPVHRVSGTAGRSGWRPRQSGPPGLRSRITPTRAAAGLGVVAAITGIYGLASSSAFDLASVRIEGLTWTDRAAIGAAVGVEEGTNVFTIETGPLVERLTHLPAVASVRAEVELPGALVIEVRERQPILCWRTGSANLLVDRTGFLFGEASEAASAGLPAVVDTRSVSQRSLAVGGHLDPIDLDAAARLGSLAPGDLGSRATELRLSVSDANGFVIESVPDDWTAIFGFYTPTVRTTEIIPGQVRLLRGLLAGREGTIARVILADAEDGTYVPKPTPTGSIEP